MKFTAKEDLAVELLIARHRLGETLWTFHKRHTKTLEGLCMTGLVGMTGGVTEKTVRAWLTEEGIKEFMPNAYAPPALKKNQAALDSIVRSAKAIVADAERVL